MPVLATSIGAAALGWSIAVSPYLWAPGISTAVGTPFGTLEAERSSGDVLSSADFAFMGTLEARNGRLGLIADLAYANLSESAESPFGGLFSRSRVENELRIASGYVTWRAYDVAPVSVDLGAGFRAMSVDVDVTLSPGALPGRQLDFGDSWVDPVVAARAQLDLNDRWFATAFADVGGFGGNSDATWQAFGSVGYRIGDRWSMQGGWRHLSIDREIDGQDVSLDLDGPLLGFTYRF